MYLALHAPLLILPDASTSIAHITSERANALLWCASCDKEWQIPRNDLSILLRFLITVSPLSSYQASSCGFPDASRRMRPSILALRAAAAPMLGPHPIRTEQVKVSVVGSSVTPEDFSGDLVSMHVDMHTVCWSVCTLGLAFPSWNAYILDVGTCLVG